MRLDVKKSLVDFIGPVVVVGGGSMYETPAIAVFGSFIVVYQGGLGCFAVCCTSFRTHRVVASMAGGCAREVVAYPCGSCGLGPYILATGFYFQVAP